MKISPIKLAVVILAATTVLSTGGAAYYFRQYQALKANPQAAVDAELVRLVAAVGELMVLPDEKPTVATVTDPEQLKDQAFFSGAKAGDKVLIYTGANKAILYDPVANKILEVAPVNAGGAAQGTGVQTAPEDPKKTR